MLLGKKHLFLAAILPLATAISSPAMARTTCKVGSEFDNYGKSTYGNTRKYEDWSLRDDFVKRGGSKDHATKKFYLANGDGTAIDDVQLLLFDGTADRNLLARVHRGIDIAQGWIPIVVAVPTHKNGVAVFNVPWEESWELMVEVRWKHDKHYKRFNESKDGKYAPFVFPVEDKGTVNGLAVGPNSWGLGVAPLYDCE